MSNGSLAWIVDFIWGIADNVLRDLYVRGKYHDAQWYQPLRKNLGKKNCELGAADIERLETTMGGKPAVVEYEPDTDLRDTEQISLLEKGGIEAFLRREVLPHAPDAWYVESSVKVGYEISLTRYFYKPQPLRSLEEMRADILVFERETKGLLGEIVGGTEG